MDDQYTERQDEQRDDVEAHLLERQTEGFVEQAEEPDVEAHLLERQTESYVD
jgi:hypothetical protein